MSALILLGVAPGVLVYSEFDDPSTIYFYGCYVLPLIILMLFNRAKLNTNLKSQFIKDSVFIKDVSLRTLPVNILLLIATLLLVFFFVKNYSVLSWSGLDDVYTQRALSKLRFSVLDKYFYLFMKYVGGLSIAAMIYTGKYIYYLLFFLIFFFDYLLGAHKFSIAIIFFMTSYLIYIKFFSSYFGGVKLFFSMVF